MQLNNDKTYDEIQERLLKVIIQLFYICNRAVYINVKIHLAALSYLFKCQITKLCPLLSYSSYMEFKGFNIIQVKHLVSKPLHTYLQLAFFSFSIFRSLRRSPSWHNAVVTTSNVEVDFKALLEKVNKLQQLRGNNKAAVTGSCLSNSRIFVVKPLLQNSPNIGIKRLSNGPVLLSHNVI